jgi:hypothetical protein
VLRDYETDATDFYVSGSGIDFDWCGEAGCFRTVAPTYLENRLVAAVGVCTEGNKVEKVNKGGAEDSAIAG